MKIVIRSNAKSIYVATCNAQRQHCNWHWADLLELLQGKVLEVETEFLFKDQYNTAGLPEAEVNEMMGNLPNYKAKEQFEYTRKALLGGLRVMAQSVDRVIDDVRPTKMRCNWCGRCGDVAEKCAHCNRNDYLERFIPGLYV